MLLDKLGGFFLLCRELYVLCRIQTGGHVISDSVSILFCVDIIIEQWGTCVHYNGNVHFFVYQLHIWEQSHTLLSKTT